MSGSGLYVLVGWQKCSKATQVCRKGPNTGAGWHYIGSVVEVSGDSYHGPCCATIVNIRHSAFSDAGPYGCVTRWANLRPLEDPDGEIAKGREEVAASQPVARYADADFESDSTVARALEEVVAAFDGAAGRNPGNGQAGSGLRSDDKRRHGDFTAQDGGEGANAAWAASWGSQT